MAFRVVPNGIAPFFETHAKSIRAPICFVYLLFFREYDKKWEWSAPFF
jgi:hypothetical protein